MTEPAQATAAWDSDTFNLLASPSALLGSSSWSRLAFCSLRRLHSACSEAAIIADALLAMEVATVFKTSRSSSLGGAQVGYFATNMLRASEIVALLRELC